MQKEIEVLSAEADRRYTEANDAFHVFFTKYRDETTLFQFACSNILEKFRGVYLKLLQEIDESSKKHASTEEDRLHQLTEICVSYSKILYSLNRTSSRINKIYRQSRQSDLN